MKKLTLSCNLKKMFSNVFFIMTKQRKKERDQIDMMIAAIRKKKQRSNY